MKRLTDKGRTDLLLIRAESGRDDFPTLNDERRGQIADALATNSPDPVAAWVTLDATEEPEPAAVGNVHAAIGLLNDANAIVLSDMGGRVPNLGEK